MKLRDYQIEIIQKVKEKLDSSKEQTTICVQLPTGTGKSVVAKHFIDEVVSNGGKVLVLVPNCSLVDNFVRYLSEYSTYVYSGVKPNFSKPVLISTYGSAKKYQKTFHPDLVVIDECHHVPAKGLAEILKNYSSNIIGFTATVNRPDGVGLNTVFRHLISGKPISWFISKGYLANYRVFVPKGSKEEFNKIMASGDDVIGNLSKIPRMAPTYKLWEEEVISRTPGKTIVFNFSIMHSKIVNSFFFSRGIESCHIDHHLSPDIRRSLIQDFNKGRIQVLNNVDCLSEGIDVHGINCVILNGFTKSSIKFMQRIGRGLRPDGRDDKVLYIIDSGKNFLYHGDVKSDKFWSLESKVKNRKPRKQAGHHYCAYCGKDLGTNSDFWSRSLIEHPDFEDYREKQVCCTDEFCDSYQNPMLVNFIEYKEPKPGNQDGQKKIDPKLNKYSELNVDYAELNILMKKRIKKQHKCEAISRLNLPKDVLKDALMDILGNSDSAKTSIMCYLGVTNV